MLKLRIGVTILISGKKYRVQGKCSYCDTGSYFALMKGKIHKNAMQRRRKKNQKEVLNSY